MESLKDTRETDESRLAPLEIEKDAWLSPASSHFNFPRYTESSHESHLIDGSEDPFRLLLGYGCVVAVVFTVVIRAVGRIQLIRCISNGGKPCLPVHRDSEVVIQVPVILTV